MEQGAAFRPVFAHLRLQYIISDLASARIVERDALIPPGGCLVPGGRLGAQLLLFCTLPSLGDVLLWACCPEGGTAFGAVIA